MKIFGLTLWQEKATLSPPTVSHVSDNRGGWWPIIREPFTGAWQRNISLDQTTILSFHAIYACISLIASDIAKLRVKLVVLEDDGIWVETTSPAFSPVLRKPNRYQTRIQFWENWIISKLTWGNTYTLKERDQRGIVVALYILDPTRVQPLVAADGSIFYSLKTDNLSGLADAVTVPASEVIHDRMNCLFHPLVGTSPVYAAALAATQGMKIQDHSINFFQNRALPGGVITAPGRIPDDAALRLKTYWEEKFSGESSGKVAVLGDGLTFEPMAINSVDSQLIEQLKWTAEVVCSVFHVPPYKIGLGPMPTANNVQSLNVEYYSQCLQSLIESAEECLDEGLGLGWATGMGTEFDIDNLLRMDTLTQISAIEKAVGAGVMAPNEGRKRLDLGPVSGGESPYLQVQNYSLEALARRDQQAQEAAQQPPPEGSPATEETDGGEDQQRSLSVEIIREDLAVRLRRQEALARAAP